jgi:SAM-dependent methyltransferase
MARKGWEVDGVDFVPQAVAGAAERARAAGVPARFHVSSVTDLGWLAGPYDLALDVGCGHALAAAGLARYRDQVWRLLRPGGLLLAFGRLRPVGWTGDDGAGLVEGPYLALFEARFTLEWSKHGQTEDPDEGAWPSGWYRFRR